MDHRISKPTALLRTDHGHQSVAAGAIQRAVQRSGICQRARSCALWHSFVVHLLEDGYVRSRVQELWGHGSVETTMVYTHVLNRGGRGVRSSLDGPA